MIHALQPIGSSPLTDRQEPRGFAKPVKTTLEQYMKRPEKLNAMSRRAVIVVAKTAFERIRELEKK